ncbi:MULTISPECIES: HAD family hydrolase [unclassified Rhizobium]|uniref:HAD family hydrolase n=1 Tax=unclassified Rhizobium TaxID=2613769 RepID=UPI00177FF817|nr:MULTISPECIES: HAD family hydrolase [unclassified Rhizobium]MBD8686371.1 HAD family hydrolase [Rhizobium sp. CFBP 13644]MBD8693628.1 HAD family hydrolase [Rhizobium sp. CFBP 13717]
MQTGNAPLLIFDCDGVLVDSEPVSIAVLIEMVAHQGVQISEKEAYERFLGRSVASMTKTLWEEYGIETDIDFLEHMRRILFERFRAELKAINGIAETLDRLSVARCVASSSQPERIRYSLGLTGLLERFEPNIFSATMVKDGKPAPDLFLHAAHEMGVAPSNCIVIEDSPAGIIAAKAAGMRVFAFTGGTHARFPAFREQIASLKPDLVFDAMPDLVQLVADQAARH